MEVGRYRLKTPPRQAPGMGAEAGAGTGLVGEDCARRLRRAAALEVDPAHAHAAPLQRQRPCPREGRSPGQGYRRCSTDRTAPACRLCAMVRLCRRGEKAGVATPSRRGRRPLGQSAGAGAAWRPVRMGRQGAARAQRRRGGGAHGGDRREAIPPAHRARDARAPARSAASESSPCRA